MAWLLALLTVAGIGELYFFLMQRSALEVCRARGLPRDARFIMVPRYYRASWVFIIGKWAAAAVLLFQGHWFVALIGVGFFFLLSGIYPVPHSHFFPMFYRQLGVRSTEIDALALMAIREALESVDREFGVTQGSQE